ncbi:MAG: OmpA family protein [Alphaproteobacteria bacterium]|nr:OmpA family protein [Alphaproteobacteria bacterium]
MATSTSSRVVVPGAPKRPSPGAAQAVTAALLASTSMLAVHGDAAAQAATQAAPVDSDYLASRAQTPSQMLPEYGFRPVTPLTSGWAYQARVATGVEGPRVASPAVVLPEPVGAPTALAVAQAPTRAPAWSPAWTGGSFAQTGPAPLTPAVVQVAPQVAQLPAAVPVMVIDSRGAHYESAPPAMMHEQGSTDEAAPSAAAPAAALPMAVGPTRSATPPRLPKAPAGKVRSAKRQAVPYAVPAARSAAQPLVANVVPALKAAPARKPRSRLDANIRAGGGRFPVAVLSRTAVPATFVSDPTGPIIIDSRTGRGRSGAAGGLVPTQGPALAPHGAGTLPPPPSMPRSFVVGSDGTPYVAKAGPSRRRADAGGGTRAQKASVERPAKPAKAEIARAAPAAPRPAVARAEKPTAPAPTPRAPVESQPIAPPPAVAAAPVAEPPAAAPVAPAPAPSALPGPTALTPPAAAPVPAPQVVAPAQLPAPQAAPAQASRVVSLPIPPQVAAVPASGDKIEIGKPYGDALATVLFGGPDAELDDSAKAILGESLPRLMADDSRQVQILAYATAVDRPDQARRLSLSRALAVRAYLIERGIRPTRFDVQAKGANLPGGPPDRVDVKLAQ